MDNATWKSCFGQWLSLVDYNSLQVFIAAHGADRYVKKLSTTALLQIYLYAQLTNASGLRELEIAVRNNEALQRELNRESISISQLSRSCARIPTEVFRTVFLDLVSKAMASIHSDKPFAPLLGLIKVIDSTTIPLCLAKYQWATFRKTKAGVKVHTRLCFIDPNQVAPDAVRITPERVADGRMLSVFVDSPDAMYVFDRGYLDYKTWDDFCSQGIRFATRLKDNAVYEVLCWEWSERVFRWMKQPLKTTAFFGTSHTAVENQIYIALIAYLLLFLARRSVETNATMLTFQRLLKELLWKS